VLRSLYSFFSVLVFAVLASLPAYPQDKSQNPKVGLDLEKPTATNNSPHLEKFDKTCDPFNQKVGKSGPPTNRPMKR
jgi:hypothetical protein